MRSLSLSLFAVVAASGCAGARWTVADSHPVVAVAVAPAELHGAASAKVARLPSPEVLIPTGLVQSLPAPRDGVAFEVQVDVSFR